MDKGWVEFEGSSIEEMEWLDFLVSVGEDLSIDDKENREKKEVEEEKELGFKLIECLNKFEVIEIRG